MKSIFSIFRSGLEKTATKVARTFSGLFTGIKAHSAESFGELEARLIAADFGVQAAGKIVGELRDRYARGLIATDADLCRAAAESITNILSGNVREIHAAQGEGPTVILMVGVNGSGKTTTIGKLAARQIADGKTVVLAACDTFRAAAVEQLQLWGKRIGAEVIAGKPGADPAGVAYDGARVALAKKADFLLIDTAGRQHNQKNLMAELAKIRRSLEKAYPGAPHEVWLTVDSTLGANVINQAREFSDAAGVTGLVLTKLDGTGRGGMVVALHQEFNLPTFFVGLGEQPEDLQPFDPKFYADAIFETVGK